MKKFAIVVAVMLVIGTTAAVAQSQSPTITDLGRGKITGPMSFEAAATSDMVVDRYVYDAAGGGHTWHSHPAAAGIVTKGSVTFWTGNAGGCTSKTYTAGQAFYDPPNVPHVAEASQDLELVVTFLGVAVGAAVSKPESGPTGPNCPAQVKPGVKRTELSRSTIQGASKAAATGDSEVLTQVVTVPAKTNFRDSWYSSPAALFASMKSGSLTVFRASAGNCTSQTYTAGQGIFVPANEPIFVRNDGSTPAEVYPTRLALPAGAAPRVDAANPTGSNCPAVAGAVAAAPGGQLPRTGASASALVMLALALAGSGTVLRGLAGRR
jgi:uncharacterized RmlC-like cupin family protein